jgi:release factor glutamine methyltransferase
MTERSGHGDLPENERLRLLALVTGRSLTQARANSEMTTAEQEGFDLLVARRLDGEPLQYLEGTVQFGPLELAVDKRVLIPRPETEFLYDLVSKRLEPGVIVDLCTGSGALALALKASFPVARVLGTDLSDSALDVAADNGAASGLDVEWLLGDLFESLPVDLCGRVDLIVANPPYVAEREWSGLPADVRREPRLALIAGPTGVEASERILGEVRTWLAPSGEAWVEVGENQASDLAQRFKGEVVVDQYGRDRFVHIVA